MVWLTLHALMAFRFDICNLCSRLSNNNNAIMINLKKTLLRGFCLFMFAARDWRRPLPSLKSCQAANLWRDYHWLSLPGRQPLKRSRLSSESMCGKPWMSFVWPNFNTHVHVQSYGHPNTKKIMTNSTFSTATYLSRCQNWQTCQNCPGLTYLSRCHPRATSRWCPCTTVFPGHELPVTKESDLWLWSQFERVLLEQSCFIKFKSFPHLWIVEKRAYSAPELCVYKLPSALPLKL